VTAKTTNGFLDRLGSTPVARAISSMQANLDCSR
jgi:hypothetical protein